MLEKAIIIPVLGSLIFKNELYLKLKTPNCILIFWLLIWLHLFSFNIPHWSLPGSVSSTQLHHHGGLLESQDFGYYQETQLSSFITAIENNIPTAWWKYIGIGYRKYIENACLFCPRVALSGPASQMEIYYMLPLWQSVYFMTIINSNCPLMATLDVTIMAQI